MGEAHRGGGDYLPRTPSLAGGEQQEPCTPIIPISDLSEQKALKNAEGPGKKRSLERGLRSMGLSALHLKSTV